MGLERLGVGWSCAALSLKVRLSATSPALTARQVGRVHAALWFAGPLLTPATGKLTACRLPCVDVTRAGRSCVLPSHSHRGN